MIVKLKAPYKKAFFSCFPWAVIFSYKRNIEAIKPRFQTVKYILFETAQHIFHSLLVNLASSYHE